MKPYDRVPKRAMESVADGPALAVREPRHGEDQGNSGKGFATTAGVGRNCSRIVRAVVADMAHLERNRTDSTADPFWAFHAVANR